VKGSSGTSLQKWWVDGIWDPTVILRLSDSDPGFSALEFGGISGHDLAFLAGGLKRMVIRSSGNVGIGTMDADRPLRVKNPSGFVNGRTTAFFENSNGYGVGIGSIEGATYGNIQAWGGGTAQNLILQASGGNVGIGTTNPSYKLDVTGTISVTGFRMPTGAGSGKVLTSDDSGLATWQTPSGVTVSREVICDARPVSVMSCPLGLLSEWKACFLTRHQPTTSSGSWDSGCFVETAGQNWVLTVSAGSGDGLRCAAVCIK